MANKRDKDFGASERLQPWADGVDIVMVLATQHVDQLHEAFSTILRAAKRHSPVNDQLHTGSKLDALDQEIKRQGKSNLKEND